MSPLHILCGAARLAECAKNEASVHPFYVQLKRGDKVRATLDVFGASKVAVQKQHECLCMDGEQCIALTPQEYDARLHVLPRGDA